MSLSAAHTHLLVEVLERLREGAGTDLNLGLCFPTTRVGRELPQLSSSSCLCEAFSLVNIFQLYHTRRFEVQGDYGVSLNFL